MGKTDKPSGGQGAPVYIAEPLRGLAVPIADMHPDPSNARKHDDKNIEAIIGSLHRFGQRIPIVVQRQGMVVRAGNGRLEAAKRMGWTHLAAVVVDEAPEPLPEAVARTGDVWLLGGHRLLCGDSTKASDVSALLRDAKPHLMVTDPPYGVEYDAEWRTDAGLQKTGAHGKVSNDDRADWTDTWSLFSGDVAYVWHADRHASTVQSSLEAAGFVMRSQIIWAKDRLAISRGDYHWQHEPCWYAVRKGKTGHWSGDRSQTTLWSIPKPRKSETGHSTQKPVECMARPVRNNSVPGDVVYEPFSGSGTTIVASEQLDRKCYAIEISPVYVDVAVRRWQTLTGKEATLEATGRAWAETAKERGVDVGTTPNQ